MNHRFDPFQRAAKPVLISHVPDKIPDSRIFCFGEFLGHFELFELIPAIHHQPLNFG